jgi:alkanesulfonate monooxygenase SsuD/methylene tetrahydromethanopterin reductase-like flavin-dependent oxidoreductase (luciferase family)
MRAYREHFEPSPFLAEPRGMVAVSATCAETTEEAERLAWSRWAARIIGAHGIGGGIPSPEEAMAFSYTAPEREYIEELRRHAIFGDAQRVRSQIRALADQYATDEVMVVTITYDFDARKRSYELLVSE